MPHIAIVEDEPEAADVLVSFIDRYAGEKDVELEKRSQSATAVTETKQFFFCSHCFLLNMNT